MAGALAPRLQGCVCQLHCGMNAERRLGSRRRSESGREDLRAGDWKTADPRRWTFSLPPKRNQSRDDPQNPPTALTFLVWRSYRRTSSFVRVTEAPLGTPTLPSRFLSQRHRRERKGRRWGETGPRARARAQARGTPCLFPSLRGSAAR